MADIYIPTAALQRWVDQLWLAAGCSADEARLTAEHLVGANLAGHDSHGVGMVPRYVSSWLANELQLNQHVAIRSDSGAMLSLDAQRGMGQSMAFEAMNLAIERARQHGVCVMGLKNAHHIGRIGHWAEQAVAAGLVSVHFVNAMSKPVVAPFRGSEARYVTNPFTVGIPVPGREPMLLDFATSAIAMGKVRVAYNSEKRVPGNVLMDAAGECTDDPAALFPPAGQPGGALLPFAQHKGYALAMVVEVLAAALTGGETTRPAHLKYQHAVWNNMLVGAVGKAARRRRADPDAGRSGARITQSEGRTFAGGCRHAGRAGCGGGGGEPRARHGTARALVAGPLSPRSRYQLPARPVQAHEQVLLADLQRLAHGFSRLVVQDTQPDHVAQA